MEQMEVEVEESRTNPAELGTKTEVEETTKVETFTKKEVEELIKSKIEETLSQVITNQTLVDSIQDEDLDNLKESLKTKLEELENLSKDLGTVVETTKKIQSEKDTNQDNSIADLSVKTINQEALDAVQTLNIKENRESLTKLLQDLSEARVRLQEIDSEVDLEKSKGDLRDDRQDSRITTIFEDIAMLKTASEKQMDAISELYIRLATRKRSLFSRIIDFFRA